MMLVWMTVSKQHCMIKALRSKLVLLGHFSQGVVIYEVYGAGDQVLDGILR